MIASILISSTLLSLASTNDYIFTTPISTNLTGKTFVLDGQGASCLVPRAEDISFLREAFEERIEAIRDTTRGLADMTVPSNIFFAAGRFNDYYTERVFFSPSFGYWDGFLYAFQNGYFVKPGVNIGTDFRETGPDYLWDGKSTTTNALKCFVNDLAVFPTNGTGSILTLTNATLAGATWLRQIKAAYEFLGKDVRVLGWDGSVHALAPSVWTDRSESNRTIVRTPEGGIRYTYPRYDGRQGSATYYTGFELSDWTTTSGKTTNAFPCTETSFVFVRDRTVNREHEEKITYWGETSADTERDVFKIGEDYEYNKVSTVPFESSGNMILDIPMADYRLTNAVKEVSAIVLARFRVLRRESFSGRGYSPVPPTTSTTNYFVFVTQTDCERRDDGKFDTELDFGARIREILNGYQIIEWCQACPLPTINAPTPSSGQTISATRARRVYLTFDDIRVFPYIRREWNARVLD